jgi:hypothetical protein
MAAIRFDLDLRMTTHASSADGPLGLGRTLGPFTVAMFLLLWVFAFYPFRDLLDRQGTPLGGDYVMFYLGGQIAADGASERLYNQEEHCRRLRQLFPTLDEGDLLPYRYPPYVAAALAPLSRLPFPVSYAVFFAISLALWLAALWLIWRQWPDFFATPGGQGLWWGALGWPVALETLAGGQASMLALLIALGGLLLLRRDKPVAAGVVLALALYKPNVLALFILGCALKRPRMLLGFVPAALVLVLSGIVCLGWETTLTYATLGQQLASQTWQTPTPYWKVHGLASWLDGMAGSKLIVISLGFVAVSAAYGLQARTPGRTSVESPPDDLYFALLLVLNTLCNPYAPVYDLVLLLLPFVLLVTCAGKLPALTDTGLALVGAALFFGPHLSQALAFRIHGQVFTIALLVCAAGLMAALLRNLPAKDGSSPVPPQRPPDRPCHVMPGN